MKVKFLCGVVGLFIYCACDKGNESPQPSTFTLDCIENPGNFVKAADCPSPVLHSTGCGTYVLPDTHYMNTEDFEWLPWICAPVGYQIPFGGETAGWETMLTIVSTSHGIRQDVIEVYCSEYHESNNYICQIYEYAEIGLIGDVLWLDTVYLRLSVMSNEVKDATVDPVHLTLKVWSSRNPSRANQFVLEHHGRYSDLSNPDPEVFHHTITLGDKIYTDVFEYRAGSAPGLMYFQRGQGLIAFEFHGYYWYATD